MRQRRLGRSGLVVSEICLGTMTFGDQADESMSFRIMDEAYERGVNFFDAAEMYPVPPGAETVGLTESVGTLAKAAQRRPDPGDQNHRCRTWLVCSTCPARQPPWTVTRWYARWNPA